jgi:tetratricopeptide (TPR) repeat protein
VKIILPFLFQVKTQEKKRMKRIFRCAAVFALVVGLFNNALATTWFPQEFTCPIDKEKNTFMVVGSYGSYIYSWSSKYQWLFFPLTDSPTYYTCKKCHLTTYMWDFDKLPKEKIVELQKLLKDVKISKNFKDYTELPVSERLEIMEKVYAVLNKDEDWWERFYRVKGYHYAQEGKVEKASEARKKSLEFTAKFLKNDKSKTPQKLLFYISGAMKHFTNDDKGALEDFQKALETKYKEEGATAEESKNGENGLNERIKDYVERIKSDKKPRLMDTQEDYQ